MGTSMSFLKKTLNLCLSSLDFIDVTAEVAREPTLNFLELFLNDDFAEGFSSDFSKFYIFVLLEKSCQMYFCFYAHEKKRNIFGCENV